MISWGAARRCCFPCTGEPAPIWPRTRRACPLRRHKKPFLSWPGTGELIRLASGEAWQNRLRLPARARLPGRLAPRQGGGKEAQTVADRRPSWLSRGVVSIAIGALQQRRDCLAIPWSRLTGIPATDAQGTQITAEVSRIACRWRPFDTFCRGAQTGGTPMLWAEAIRPAAIRRIPGAPPWNNKSLLATCM